MINALVERLAAVPRLLVATDFDGVLAPIVEDPDNTMAMPESLAALRSLAERPETVVAVVSGRGYRTLEQLVAPADRFHLVGSHGAEMGVVSLSPQEQETFDQMVATLHSLADRHAGLHIEAKTVSVAVHLRRLADDADRPAVNETLGELADRWPGKIVTGKEVVEFSIRHATKGDAVQALAAHHEVDATVYLGDDVTDEDVFVVLGAADIGIKVGDGPTAAGDRLSGPAEVAGLLTELAQRRPAPS